MKNLFLLACCLILNVFQTNAQDAILQTKATKATADSAYVREDYATAIQIYESLLQEGEAAEVYYNLGNSYYKNDELAKAILNYERALLLEPGNEDVRTNLEIARAKTVDKVTPVPEIFFVSWTKSLVNLMGVDAWAICGVAFFLLSLGAVSLFLFSKEEMLKKVGFFVGIACFFFMVLSNVFANSQQKALTQRTGAIVLQPTVTVRSTPSETGTSLFILHEGHKVEVKDDSMNEWTEISLEDGKVGWIPAGAIEVI